MELNKHLYCCTPVWWGNKRQQTSFIGVLSLKMIFSEIAFLHFICIHANSIWFSKLNSTFRLHIHLTKNGAHLSLHHTSEELDELPVLRRKTNASVFEVSEGLPLAGRHFQVLSLHQMSLNSFPVGVPGVPAGSASDDPGPAARSYLQSWLSSCSTLLFHLDPDPALLPVLLVPEPRCSLLSSVPN